MKQLTINDKNYRLPSSWNEMSKKQFLKVCYVRSKNINEVSQLELNASRIIFFTILSGVPKRIIDKINASTWVDILPHMNFVVETPDLMNSPTPKISFGMFSSLRGPVGMLDHSSFDEMSAADTNFIRANQTGDLKYFYQLFATLWRPVRNDLHEFKHDPKNWNGDIREPYNSTVVSSRIDKIKKKVPFYYVIGAFMYYWSFRKNILEKGFPNYFDGDKSTDKSANDYGWAGPLLELASSGVFGNAKETRTQHWKLIMIEISRQIDKKNEIEAAAERARKNK